MFICDRTFQEFVHQLGKHATYTESYTWSLTVMYHITRMKSRIITKLHPCCTVPKCTFASQHCRAPITVYGGPFGGSHSSQCAAVLTLRRIGRNDIDRRDQVTNTSHHIPKIVVPVLILYAKFKTEQIQHKIAKSPSDLILYKY